MKRLVFLLAAIASFATPAVAHADGYLSPGEERFGDRISTALCNYIDDNGVNATSMYQAVRIIYNNTPANVDASDAVDIINYVVEIYCPDHWNELVAFGNAMRGTA
jgi:hypothetical protein